MHHYIMDSEMIWDILKFPNLGITQLAARYSVIMVMARVQPFEQGLASLSQAQPF